MDKNLNKTLLSKQKTMLIYFIYNFYNKYINIFNKDRNNISSESKESSCIDYEYSTKLSGGSENKSKESSCIDYEYSTKLSDESDNESNSSEDTNIFDVFFKSKENKIETYLKHDNKIYNEITTQIQEIEINSDDYRNKSSEVINKISDSSTQSNNDVIQSIKLNLETLHSKIDKVVNNKKLIEFTEVLNNQSISETEKQIDTIQLWNNIEKKNKKSKQKYYDSPENNTSILESYMYSNQNKNNIFISCNKKEENTISEQTTSSISVISDDKAIIDKYIIKENSENEKDLIEFYFPRFNDKKKKN
jgi:hypothetical protein